MVLLQFIPNTPAAVHQLTWLLTAIDQLVNTVGPVMVPLAQQWGQAFAVGALTFWCAKWACDFLCHHGEVMIPELILFVFRLIFVSLMLGFYTVPIPGIGVPFPQIFTTIGSEIAGTIGIQTLDNLLALINACVTGLEHPPMWNFLGLFYYFFVLISMVVLDSVLLLVTGLGFFAVGIGTVFGPLLITFLLVPGWSGKFWNWVNFMLVYSFYRAVAAAFVYVVSMFLSNFFQNLVNGDYSLGHFAALFLFMISSILMVIYAAFKVPHWTIELFGGGLGHAGADFGNQLRSVIFMLGRA